MQEGEAQNLKAMLTPIQLVKGAIAVMERVPDAAFGLSDLVANLCQRDDGKLRNQILEQILINLRGDQSIEVCYQILLLVCLPFRACKHLLTNSPLQVDVLQMKVAGNKAWACPHKAALTCMTHLCFKGRSICLPAHHLSSSTFCPMSNRYITA